ncbi:hypothetical protein [Paenibacillus sp. MMS18-CY102]|uniref:hypothetical protein n=1 Tax=Paenibacillus sp. MMS18-CY102 TaxID=2682849 RepID=UPI0013661882|nr:hypothetical protein [Paenibacillus sp. MMS18-CY102]MWC28557.1 hypothetical protein [Paenibacillus sp. MMS18-CY102]
MSTGIQAQIIAGDEIVFDKEAGLQSIVRIRNRAEVELLPSVVVLQCLYKLLFDQDETTVNLDIFCLNESGQVVFHDMLTEISNVREPGMPPGIDIAAFVRILVMEEGVHLIRLESEGTVLAQYPLLIQASGHQEDAAS